MNDSKFQGVRVLNLIPDSPAVIAGIQVGDLILSVDGVAVKTMEEYAKQAGKRNGDMTVCIMRGALVQDVVIPKNKDML